MRGREKRRGWGDKLTNLSNTQKIVIPHNSPPIKLYKLFPTGPMVATISVCDAKT